MALSPQQSIPSGRIYSDLNSAATPGTQKATKSVLAIYGLSDQHNHTVALSHRQNSATPMVNSTRNSFINTTSNRYSTIPQLNLIPKITDNFNSTNTLLNINSIQLQPHLDHHSTQSSPQLLINRQGLKTAPSKLSQQSVISNSSFVKLRSSFQKDRYSTNPNTPSYPSQSRPQTASPFSSPLSKLFNLPQENTSNFMRKQSATYQTVFTQHRMFRPHPPALFQKQQDEGDESGMMRQVVSNNDNSNYYYLTAKNQQWNTAKDKWIEALGGCLLSQPVQINDNVQLRSKNLLRKKNTQHGGNLFGLRPVQIQIRQKQIIKNEGQEKQQNNLLPTKQEPLIIEQTVKDVNQQQINIQKVHILSSKSNSKQQQQQQLSLKITKLSK